MTRFFCGILLAASLAGTLHAQGSKYTPVQGGTRDPDALKKLAAMLGNGGQPQIDPQMKEILEKWLKATENDPEARQRMIDFARKQKEENPEQFQQDFRKNNPNISDDDLKKLMQGLGKPGDPPPELPKPGPGPMPPNITPKPMPQPGDPPIPPQPDQNGGFPDQPKPPINKPNPNQPKQNAEQVEGALQMWEQTVGPIDSTPAVKDAIVDLFGNGAGGAGEKPFWMNGPEGQSGSSSSSNSGFWKFMNGSSSSGSTGSNWNTPSWLKNFSAGSPSTPSAPKTSVSGPSMPGMGGIGSIGALGSAGTVLLFLVIAGVVGFLLWKFLPMIREARNRRLQPLPGQGPWPVDPRTIRDREALVIAFEYLSVLVCGNGAVVWNHETIAEALREALPDREHLAGPLARLYAVARYTPLREEIPESAYAEARRCLCALAGVSEG